MSRDVIESLENLAIQVIDNDCPVTGWAIRCRDVILIANNYSLFVLYDLTGRGCCTVWVLSENRNCITRCRGLRLGKQGMESIWF